MAEYNEIPGRSDLFWKANDGFLNLYGIGSTGRRAARLGAPLRIVDEMIAVAPILVYAPISTSSPPPIFSPMAD